MPHERWVLPGPRKNLSLAKTLVTNFNTEVADLALRQRQIRSSIAAAVPVSASLRIGDFNLVGTQSLVLLDIRVSIQIFSYAAFIVQLMNNMSSIAVPCSGLFLVYGTFDQITVQRDTEDTRITYICA